MFRRGAVPAQGEHGDFDVHWWTRRGFFGSYAVLYKTRNPGDALRWEEGLGPAAVDTAKLRPSDMDGPDGLPLPVITNGDITILVSRRVTPMPSCWRNADADELYFIDRGRCRFETEFGRLQAQPGDLVFLPRNVVYRTVPLTADTLHVILETRPFLESADAYHRQHGEAAHGLNMSAIEVPEPWENPDRGQARYEVRTRVEGRVLTSIFDFDPVGVTAGWAGDPIVFKLSAWDVPCANLPSSPPTAAVFMTDDKEAMVTVHTPMRGPGGGGGPPAHTNDYDEVWFQHSPDGVGDGRAGLLRWDPQGATQPGGRAPHRPGELPPGAGSRRLNLNVDVRKRLHFTADVRPFVVEERAAALATA
jgi:homogentisate 1,2-dioxygenase